jgi:uncharacterized protein YndB with AHSA1/START domain
MRRLHFSIDIDAPREQVWETMLGDAGYRVWTSEFTAGSHYVGDWSEGSRILFLGPGQTGESGLVSRIRTNRPHERISIEHLGIIEEGEEDTASEAVRAWAGAQENYIFRDAGGRTELLVEMDSDEKHRAVFEETWPRALRRLKELVEEGA